MTSKRVRLWHYEGHRADTDFDYYCVAHGTDYSPAYLDGGVCHSGMDEGYCHPDCRVCPQRCPVEPCPLPESVS